MSLPNNPGVANVLSSEFLYDAVPGAAELQSLKLLNDFIKNPQDFDPDIRGVADDRMKFLVAALKARNDPNLQNLYMTSGAGMNGLFAIANVLKLRASEKETGELLDIYNTEADVYNYKAKNPRLAASLGKTFIRARP